MKFMCPWYFNLIFILYTHIHISREDWKSFSSDWLNKKNEKIVSAIAEINFRSNK